MKSWLSKVLPVTLFFSSSFAVAQASTTLQDLRRIATEVGNELADAGSSSRANETMHALKTFTTKYLREAAVPDKVAIEQLNRDLQQVEDLAFGDATLDARFKREWYETVHKTLQTILAPHRNASYGVIDKLLTPHSTRAWADSIVELRQVLSQYSPPAPERVSKTPKAVNKPVAIKEFTGLQKLALTVRQELAGERNPLLALASAQKLIRETTQWLELEFTKADPNPRTIEVTLEEIEQMAFNETPWGTELRHTIRAELDQVLAFQQLVLESQLENSSGAQNLEMRMSPARPLTLSSTIFFSFLTAGYLLPGEHLAAFAITGIGAAMILPIPIEPLLQKLDRRKQLQQTRKVVRQLSALRESRVYNCQNMLLPNPEKSE